MNDPFEIPRVADRRNDPKTRVVIPKRQWIMPTSKRLDRAKHQRAKESAAIKRAEQRDLAKFDEESEAIDQVVRLQRKSK
ncbi:MAG: hypothetical protein ACR2PS_00260 [Pseudomonadales bacterium]